MPALTPVAAAPRLRRAAALVALPAALGLPASAGAQVAGSDDAVETVFYMTDRPASLESFRAHRDRISVAAPQVYSVRGDGVVWGSVDPRLLDLAREAGVAVVPLIHNPGFDQDDIHELLADSAARARTVRSMVDLAERHDFAGWQFDFENIHIADRDRFTAFYREAAGALHAAGRSLSVAVVPTDGTGGVNDFHRWMRVNWRGSFDLPALAEAGDFISLMTYAQHGRVSTPGPVAGLPWMRAMVEHALDRGVPPEKLSLGVPSYSYHWYPAHQGGDDAHATGRGVYFEPATDLLDRFGVEPTWLPEQGTSFAYFENGGTFEWLFYEDRRAFEAKLALLDEHPGLRGISVWVLGAEDPGIWEVLEEREVR